MYLIVMGWLYVVLMMSVAEATSSQGSLLGALITFVLYGLLPAALVAYLLGTPARRKALRQQEAQARAEAMAQQATPSNPPDTSRHAPGVAAVPPPEAAVPPVGEKS